MKDQDYKKLLEELEEAKNILKRGFYDIKKEVMSKKKIDISKPFSVLNFPSKGLYYPSKQDSILVKYLTAVEEHVLTDSFLVETGRGIKLVLDNLILDDLDVQDLLIGDFQALLIFLRSTAFGDKVEINPTCPHCGKAAENDFLLSSLNFKEHENKPDSNGKYNVEIPELKLNFILTPMTFKKELEKAFEEDRDEGYVFKDSDGEIIVKKTRSLSLSYYIESINNVSDKEIIKKIIKRIPKKHTNDLFEFIKKNESGVEDFITLSCPYCGNDFSQKTDMGYNFLSLPYEYKETILEEIFLITYYGKGVTRQDAMEMATYERKWHIRRIKEELDKKSKAETAAYNKAKGKK